MDNKEGKNLIVGIDIGSTNVVMAVGERNQDGEIAVLGVEIQKIENCVKDGDVTNHLLLGDAIIKAKSALENELDIRLNSAYVGISGRSVYCVRYEDYVDINEKTGCVTDFEMRELNARIDMVVPAGGDQILDRIPLRYTIDDRQEVQKPLGSYGRKLSVTYLFILVGRHQIDRVNRALHRAEMRSCGLYVNPALLPDLLLNPEEKEEGVAIVDIGGDLTDITVVREGKLHYFCSLPIGSSSINNDLYEFLRIPKKDLDLLKHKHGAAIAAAVPEDAAITVKTAGHAKKQVLQRNIAEIAEERLKDIAQFVLRELKAAKLSTKIPCGIVLTGGAAYLSDIEQLFARELNMEVRLGKMLYGLDDNSQEQVCPLPQSVAMGLLVYGAKHDACDTTANPLHVVKEIQGENEPTVASVDVSESTNPVETQVAPSVEEDKTSTTESEEPVNNESKSVDEVQNTTEVKVESNVPQTNETEKPPHHESGNDGNDGNDDDDDDDGNDDNNGDDGNKPKSGWMNRIINWVNNRFDDDQYI